MTREQILSMPVGRELDKLVRIMIIGDITAEWRWFEEWGEHWIVNNSDRPTWFLLPSYSTDISATWEVVEKLSRGRTNNSFFLELHYERYFASFGNVNPLIFKTAPEAICKAALLASLGESGGTDV